MQSAFLLHRFTVQIIISTFCLAGCSPIAPPGSRVAENVDEHSVFLMDIDLGVLRQGELFRYRVWLRNDSPIAMAIERFNSSCECVSFQLSENRISASGRELLTLVFDGELAPEFVGNLAISASAEDDAGKVLGRLRIAVEVVPCDDPHIPVVRSILERPAAD